MPVVARFNGSRIVHEVVPWPPECKLVARDPATMTQQELRDELALLMTHKEEDLHRACCTNAGCPAKR